jgi:predicted glycosyltransferase
VSQFNPCATHAAHLSNARSIVFSDDETATEIAGKITNPFTTLVYTPRAFNRNLGPKHRRYDGYHQLAYLHPSRFEPDRSVLETNGVDPDTTYFVLQFDSWEGADEGGTSGLSTDAKRDLIEFLSQHGTVYVAAAFDLPGDLPVGSIPVPPAETALFVCIP